MEENVTITLLVYNAKTEQIEEWEVDVPLIVADYIESLSHQIAVLSEDNEALEEMFVRGDLALTAIRNSRNLS